MHNPACDNIDVDREYLLVANETQLLAVPTPRGSPSPFVDTCRAWCQQIEANRRNTQKSTSPKTAEGKAKSKFKA